MATQKQIQSTLFNAGVPSAQIGALTAKVQQNAPATKAEEYYRNMEDLISKSEGTYDRANPYATAFGGGQLTDLSRHPGKGATFKQTDGKVNTTTAAGKVQWLKSTWDEISAKTGVKDFSPESQYINYKQLMKDKKVDKLIESGDFTGAIQKLGGTFASLPSSKYKQPKNSWEKLAQYQKEIDGSILPIPTYAGVVNKPTGPKYTEDDILNAALPTAQENLAEAAQRDAAALAEQEAVFADQQALQQNEMQAKASARSGEIDAMLSSAFGYDDVFKPKKDTSTSYDAQLRKLIEQV